MVFVLDLERDAKGSYGLPLPERIDNKKTYKKAAIALLALGTVGVAVPCIDMRPLASEFKQHNSGRSFDKPDCQRIRDSFSTNGAKRVLVSFHPEDKAFRRASDAQLQQCHIMPPQVR